MKIRLLKGVSGYWNGRSFRYPRGAEVDVIDEIGNDLVRHGNAEKAGSEKKVVPVFTPQAFTPEIKDGEVKKSVIRRRKRV